MTGEPAGPEAPRRSARRLAALFRPERSGVIAVDVLCVLSAAFSIAGPALLGKATNIIFSGVVSQLVPAGMTKAQAVAALRAHGQGQLADIFAAMDIVPHAGVAVSRLGAVLGLTAVVYALSAGFSLGQGYLIAGISTRTVYRLRQQIAGKLARLPLRYFDGHPHGDILSRVANDVDNIDASLYDVLTQMPTAVVRTLGIIGVMFWFSPLLATISVSTVPLMLVAATLIARRSKARFDAQWEHTGRLTALAEESFTGHALVHAFGQRLPMEAEFSRENKLVSHASFRAQFIAGVILPVFLFAGNLNYVLVAVVGGYWVATGVISLGTVQAFIQYSQQLTSPMAQLAGQVNRVQSGLASAERVFEFLDEPEEAALPGAVTAGTAGALGQVHRKRDVGRHRAHRGQDGRRAEHAEYERPGPGRHQAGQPGPRGQPAGGTGSARHQGKQEGRDHRLHQGGGRGRRPARHRKRSGEQGVGQGERDRRVADVAQPGDRADPEPLEPDRSAHASAARGVRFSRVCFRYEPETPLLEDFTLEAVPGQTVAIVGPTGAGKTTIASLLVRFYEIDSGQILLDGVDYRALSRAEVRRCFGMVLQDAWLFSGSVRDNIAYGRQGASDEEIRAAARAAHADDFIATLPSGYATVVDGDNSGMSSGQKQLLCIARAFLADPGILILDEATSNVDTRTEAQIQSAMTRLRSGRTSFVIAHRLSTVRAADTIVVMRDGRVVEQGSHDDLLDLHGLYHSLYNSQFEKTGSPS
jgi:ABC-type multidrug transport system fused ATPase/permease subunit